MAVNKRGAAKAKILMIDCMTTEEDFEQKSRKDCEELRSQLMKAFEDFQEYHLQVVGDIEPENAQELESHEEILTDIFSTYIRAKSALTKAMDDALDKEVLKDLSMHPGGSRHALELDMQRKQALAASAAGNPKATSSVNGNDEDGRSQGSIEQNSAEALAAINRAVRSNRKLEVMSFAGEQEKWAEWRSAFETYVHFDNTYSDTEKFYYLKKSLQGVAANILLGWNATGANYQAAYKSIVEVFENKYRMVMSHLNELFKMPQFANENFAGLRTLIDTTKSVIRQLEIAGSPVAQWDHIICFMLISRMSPRTLGLWENSKDLTEMPTLNELFEFLERRARSQVNFELSKSQSSQQQNDKSQSSGSKQGSSNQASNSYQANKQGSKQYKSGKPFEGKNQSEQRGISCYNCQQPHPMFRCAKFTELPIQARINRVRELKLCANCMSPNHKAGSLSCRSGKCERWKKGAHNSLLCLSSVATSNAVIAYHEPSIVQEQGQSQMQLSSIAPQSASNPNTYRPTMDSLATSGRQLTVGSTQAQNFR